ncbi:Dps family protein [Hymenobacter actinosclerus]|uniref:Starvation-inducible DNA-binding protein n=1 Tax=Hymenobacter actinosclerus TaxID=82805 RepID=A0A1H9ZNS3_9BACT|nr:DNA starvation/stationary phase protection protein [Hymenobacter actinosclerus]SES83317.1 starvation-inducible DNA-binding protein [Hymenobacter actinosclerus]
MATTTEQIDLLATPSDLDEAGREKVATGLQHLVADAFALYVKTKNYHWHMSGRNFRDYHLLLDEQSQQIYAIIDPLAERTRKLGFLTLHSIGEIARLQRIQDSDDSYVTPLDMLTNLTDDNRTLAHHMRELHGHCDDAKDVGTASLLEEYIDEAERRIWFLYEATRPVE